MFVTRLIAVWLFAAGFPVALFVQGVTNHVQDATPVMESLGVGPAHLGGDLPGDPQIQLVQVAAGLQNPVNVAFPRDGSGRIFVVEQRGTVRIVNADGSIEPKPFLDLTATTGIVQPEQGLLGLAFHPDYATNGRFYVDYTDLV